MDQQLVQRTRYLLRSRFRRVQSCPVTLLSSACGHLQEWLDAHPAIGPTIALLRRQNPTTEEAVADIWQRAALSRGFEVPRAVLDTVDQQAVMAYAAIRNLAASGPACWSDGQMHLFVNALAEHVVGEVEAGDKIEDYLRNVRDHMFDVLFEYLDERMDERIALHGVLRKFKQRAEHFDASALRATAAAATPGGERGLAIELQKYVFDHGIDMSVEHDSRSGRVDLLLRDPNGRVVVVDAKYVRAGSSRSQVKKILAGGLHQVQRYCHDYDEPYGHLVVFSELHELLCPELEELGGMRFLSLGGKQILFLEVRIGDLPSASTAGTAREMVFASAELVQAIADEGLGEMVDSTPTI